jgi:hypothetical protein
LGGELLEHARAHVSGGQQHAWLSCPRPACSFRLTVGRSLLRFTVLALQHVHAHHQEEEGQAHPPATPTINPHHDWKLGTVENSFCRVMDPYSAFQVNPIRIQGLMAKNLRTKIQLNIFKILF